MHPVRGIMVRPSPVGVSLEWGVEYLVRGNLGVLRGPMLPGVTTSAASVAGDELVRQTRERSVHGDSEFRAQLALGFLGVAGAAAIVGTALFVDGENSFDPARFAFFVVLYALVSRVEFEVGIGSAIPTQLVLVPMLFALHIGLVPAAVLFALLLRTVGDRPWPLRSPMRALAHFAFASHAVGPVLVLAFAGGLPLRWSAWPIYLAALAAQFATDFLNAVLNGVATGVSVRAILRDAPSVYMV